MSRSDIHTNKEHLIYNYSRVPPWASPASPILSTGHYQPMSHAHPHNLYISPRLLDIVSKYPGLPEFWIETSTGKEFHFFDARESGVDDINLTDISSALAEEPMFSGQCKRTSPKVAQHAMLMWALGRYAWKASDAEACTTDVLLGLLLHDAYKAYLKDIGGPLRRLLSYMSCSASELYTGNSSPVEVGQKLGIYELLVQHVRDRIYKKFEVVLDPNEEYIIDSCDKMALLIETHMYMPSTGTDWPVLNDFIKSDVYEQVFAGLGYPDKRDELFRKMVYYPHAQSSDEIQLWYTRALQLYGVDV